MLFALLGAAFLLRHDDSNRSYWLFLSGLMVGIVFVFKYNVGIFLLASGMAAILIKQFMKADGLPVNTRQVFAVMKKALVYFSGFGLIVGAMFIYLAHQRALGPMIDHFLHHAAEYSEKRAAPLPSVKLIIPVALGLMVAVAAGWAIWRKAPGLFVKYLALIVILGSIVLFIPGRMYILKESASASIAYFPPVFFLFLLGIAVGQ